MGDTSANSMPDSDDIGICEAYDTIERERSNLISGHLDLMPDSDDDEICSAYDAIQRESNRIPDDLLHLVQNSPKEIERNRLQAMIRRRNHADGGPAMVDIIADRFYDVSEWPSYILKIMISPDFKYSKRLALACFFVGNGLTDFNLVLAIFKFYNTHWRVTQLWNKRFSEFRDLFNYLNKPPDDPDYVRIQSQYFFYSIEDRQTLYLDGSIRRT